MSVLDFPFFQGDSKPEGINSNSDEAEQPPFDPVSEKLDGAAVKYEAFAFDYGVFCFPAVHHAESPWVTDAKCENRHQAA